MSRTQNNNNPVSHHDAEGTYFLSNKGIYDEHFLSQISQEIYEQNVSEQVRRAKIIAKLDNRDNFPTVSYNLIEEGPKLAFKDFSRLPPHFNFDRDLEAYLTNLGISLMIGLGQGHDYNEGLFEMPAPGVLDHRVMVISIRLPNVLAKDERLRNLYGYFQIAIFMPKALLEFLPSFSSIEDQIIPLVKDKVKDETMISNQVPAIKAKVLTLLTEIALFYTKWKPSHDLL